MPELVRVELTDALVSPWSSSVLLGRSVYVEQLPDPRAALHSHAAGHLVMHSTRRALVRSGPMESLPSGFFLGGNGAFNYYHWLIEILPKLEFLPAPIGEPLPLLVPAEVGTTPSMRQALERFAPESPVVYLDPGVIYRVSHLVHVNNLNICPFNLLPGQVYQVGDFAFRPESVEFLRRPLSRELRQGATAPSRARRLFLARGNARRGYNQDEIIEICTRYGFDVVRPETLTFTDQVMLFAGAEVIVGPTGAAWSNIVFAAPGVRGLTWLPAAFREFSAFSNLTRLAGGELTAMIYQGAPDSTGALYEHDYVLDPVDFERELSALLSSA